MILNFVFLSLLPAVSVDSWRIKTELDYLPTPPTPPAPPPPSPSPQVFISIRATIKPKTPNYLSLTLYIRLS